MKSYAPRALKIFHNPVTAWVVLAGGFLMTAAAWYVSRESVHTRALDRFDFRTAEVSQEIQDRMTVYEQMLWGGVGLFSASGFPEDAEWRRYVETIDLEEHWPGIQGIGVSVPVAPAGVDALVAERRASGFPEYAIAPNGERSEYSAIVYLEPLDWRNQRAIGFDMWSNEERRTAMARARDTGEAATSSVITLVQETEEDVQKGFLTYLPVYRGGGIPASIEERRDQLIAWVYAPFRIGDLLEGIHVTGADDVAFELFDGAVPSEDNKLFASPADLIAASGGRTLERFMSISLQGRNWTVQFNSNEAAMVGSVVSQPSIVAFGGLIIDFLLFYVIGSLALVQRRASKLADSMTHELRRARDDLATKNQLLETHTDVLERSNRELEEFAFAASHDLQEPLRGIGSFAELLHERYYDDFDEDGRAWLDYVVSGARRMSTLVSDLLGYSRVDAAEMAFTSVSLDDALDRALDGLTVAIEEQGLTVERESLPNVEGNAAQLSQLFQNIVTNAIKYGPPDVDPMIQVTCVQEDAACEVRIRDNGIGIDSKHHATIFQIFKRVNSRKQYPGNGIGLSTCRKIAERHAGDIRVESKLGEGSTFVIRLPKSPVVELHSPVVEFHGAQQRKRRVLIQT